METWFIKKNEKKMGLKGNMLAYVNNFLSDRVLQVKINNTFSDIFVLENGTPREVVLVQRLLILWLMTYQIV